LGHIGPGNAHGDFYLHNLYFQDDEGGAEVKSSYQRILGLHKGPIHALAVGALYRIEEKLGWGLGSWNPGPAWVVIISPLTEGRKKCPRFVDIPFYNL
jgi:hypothetical protein